ncbi:hypothetical protein ACFL0R_04675 [Pseudomonadota bacterium]
MTTLTGKEQRTLLFAAKRLFGVKSLFFSESLSDIPTKQYFVRKLRLRGNRSVFLTDSGYEHFCTVVDVMDRADYFDGMAEFSDISHAWRSVVEKWISDGLEPERADEVVQAIADLVAQEVDDHTFVVPLIGIELDGVDSFALGTLTTLRMSVDVFDSAGVAHNHADVSHLFESDNNNLWLKGTTHGTQRVALQRFSEQAALTIGMLAITAASTYEWGASNFRIGVVMTPEEAIGRSVWYSWHERGRSLTTHYASPRGQPFPVNKALGDESDMVRMIYRGLAILQASGRTELEEAIARAVYWYSDAHRDPVLVMKLVKYWSCVEAFFSFENEEITHAVSAGLASILVFGGFRFVPPSEYSALKKQITNLYGLRSRAVHRGSHRHTTERDVAEFSQWVGWMIISMVGLVEQGYTNLKEVRAQTDRLDGLEKQKDEK